MKNLSKLIIAAFSFATLFFASNVKAQTNTAAPNPWRFGIGLEVGAPTGNAHDISNFELGGTARLQYDASDHFAWTLTSGYYNMFGKDVTVITPAGTVTGKAADLGIVPVKLGIKTFFSSNLYFGAEAGAGFETVSNGNTKLILSPTLGFANHTWDVGLRYENFSGQSNNYGLVGLRVAYAFGL
ncbi:MAG TPA: hypothetical protein VNX40_14770 [Mucilaginibacter sp.]|jgi:hypothetical protein|nr:hypothetical protein [Mucilaginibacter sp.]